MEHKMDWSLVTILGLVLICATILVALGKLDATGAMPIFSGLATGIFALAMPRGNGDAK